MKNRILILLTATCLIISCNSNPTNDDYKVRITNELETFMDSYAIMLRNREMDKIANLYYNGDIIISGNGMNRVVSFDSLKAKYLRQSRDTINFKWENIRIDPLTKDKAMITSIFYWNSNDQSDTLKFSYTGMFIKTVKGWKIKHEHESYKCD